MRRRRHAPAIATTRSAQESVSSDGICGYTFRAIHMRLAILCVIAAGAAGQPQSITTLDGRAVDPLRATEGVAATALIFVRTDCPIANQAAPDIERLRAHYGGRGVRFWLVYVDPREPAERVRAHLREFRLAAPALRDPDHALVRRAGVHVTPEAALYLHDQKEPQMVYRGRLDDRVVEVGRRRPRATRFDLQEAIEAALARTAPALVTTSAAGCEIADLR